MLPELCQRRGHAQGRQDQAETALAQLVPADFGALAGIGVRPVQAGTSAWGSLGLRRAGGLPRGGQRAAIIDNLLGETGIGTAPALQAQAQAVQALTQMVHARTAAGQAGEDRGQVGQAARQLDQVVEGAVAIEDQVGATPLRQALQRQPQALQAGVQFVQALPHQGQGTADLATFAEQVGRPFAHHAVAERGAEELRGGLETGGPQSMMKVAAPGRISPNPSCLRAKSASSRWWLTTTTSASCAARGP